MDQLPFSVYDFFGYLSAGFVLLVGLVAAFTGTDSWQETPSLMVGLLLVVAAYTAGHVIANISGHLVEGAFVGKLVGKPSIVLFEAVPSRWAKVFPGYFRPLPRNQRERVLERASAAGIHKAGDALFFHCFGVVKEREPVAVRLNTFLNLYGFCRNMAVALLFTAVALLAGTLLGSAKTGAVVPPGWWAAGGGLASIGLLYRYLKFYRHYAVEVFISYAEGPVPKP